MSWTAVDFHQRIELPYGVALVGWPTNIARTNLSKIGGCDILDKLLTKWRTGSMWFERLDPAKRPVRLELRRHTRSDAGHLHVFADKREPMKRKRRGNKVPKSAHIIENSDVGSDADATAGGNIGSRTESGIPVSAQVQQDAASLQPSALPPSTRTWGDNTPGQQVFALDALKDEVAHLLLAKPHTTELLLVPHERRSAGEPGEGADAEAARHYVNKAVLGIVFDHAEEATDACPCDKLGHWRWQRITPMFARCVPQKAKRTPVRSKHMGKVKAGADTDAPVRGVASPEERAGLTDCARIDLAVYLNLLWSVPLGVRPADLVQELLLILRERLAGEGGKDTARRDMYKAALRTADACSCRGGIRRGVEPGRIAQSVVEDAEFRAKSECDKGMCRSARALAV
ncbi:predicted protein [Postia placenta Mad-698-R]|nr:predicted protein [Postia placenta Mad-698-R]